MIYQSIHNPERPALNTGNEGIRKAIELIDYENFTPEERTTSKNKEANRTIVATYRMIEKTEIAKKSISQGLENEVIALITDLSIEFIENLRQ